MHPGEYNLRPEPVLCNEGRPTAAVEVTNTGDRPIQVGSHFHFAEVNAALHFDRAAAHGFRLDIPAGTAVRFEPGDAKTANLVAIGGAREVYGLANHVNGPLDAVSERNDGGDGGAADGGPDRAETHK
jgi:urease subunit beta